LREDSCGILATTGYGFTDDVAKRLRETRVYSISISLDSADELEHDRKRGVAGAFRIALQGIETALKNGFYTYTCAVPTKKLLREEEFERLVELNRHLGVHELQLIEPAPAGKLGSRTLDFGPDEVAAIFNFMAEYNRKVDSLAISSFAHMESPEFFGCGAAHSHIYVDGTGEVSPCNMIPITYGNAAEEDIAAIISRMQQCIKQPCRTCLAYDLQPYFIEHAGGHRPVPAGAIPPLPFPAPAELPGFFQLVRNRESGVAGKEEIVRGYTDASATYEDYWLSVASGPIDELFETMAIPSGGRALDCGCGTGYATAKLSARVGPGGHVLGADLTPGMINQAHRRIGNLGLTNVEFRQGDVRELLKELPADSYDIGVLSWLIGYVSCAEIFPLLARVIRPNGCIGFVAHLDRSPLVPMEIFEDLVREEPDCLMKAVKMYFPADTAEIEHHLLAAGFAPETIKHGTFTFTCRTGRGVYDHVMKSGAGTTFYYSLRPSARARLAEEFIHRVEQRFRGLPEISITHEYVMGVGRIRG
jgi:SAM-dependent methyltransferase